MNEAQEILKEFSRWADDRITDCHIPSLSPQHHIILDTREDTLNSAKAKLMRIVREVEIENDYRRSHQGINRTL